MSTVRSTQARLDVHAQCLLREADPYARMYAFLPGRWLVYTVDQLATESMSSPNTRGHVPYFIEFFPWLKAPDNYFRSGRHPGK